MKPNELTTTITNCIARLSEAADAEQDTYRRWQYQNAIRLMRDIMKEVQL